ncbi:MAG: homoserine dehydrogenase [Thiotrichales bacterium]|jgi:homoserine dehydrogenase|nr:homoserine dehydrogenase [Thiotrichales bacterium]MBT3612764.1 homoserine dehydrogenase [Thiotrichales bacterium]MBT3751914.1 homoserine dehydrogenase [Thiotrichales bacterium]MBT3837014.1 homoserine dehydrogenase [Thiotrichales bacterium]MBT4152570.1 homoserine dehydrogenase [Thiotrichales bacterium]
MKPVKIGVLGLGTVGCGSVTVLTRNAEEIARRAGRKIEVSMAAVRDLDRARICNTEGIRLTTDPFEVANDPEVEIVLELMGGTELAREVVLQAIAEGKHIVTANKALIAIHGNELFSKAQEMGVMVAFEAAVAGGIPIIKAIREGLAANQINWLAGIINGTGNFILTEMKERGRSFENVLTEAQELGYAEADPSFDVEGTDAAHKLTILASIAFGIPLQFEKAMTEGITKITTQDVSYAEELGYRIKHLGVARMSSGGVELRVHPTLIPERQLIANVDGVMNAVLVMGDAVGPTLYYGAGAGDEPTASAVVADTVDVVRALTSDPENRVPHLAFQPDALTDIPILPIEEIKTAYYLRISVEDSPGVLAEITKILGDEEINIESFMQKDVEGEGVNENSSSWVPIILLTKVCREGRMNRAIAAIETLDCVAGEVMRIRVESLD